MQGLDPVVEEEGLAAAVGLALDRPAHQLLVVGTNVGANRPAPLGGRLDHRDVAHTRQAHLESPRDGRRRHREHVDLELQLAQELLLADPEALLLVEDQQPQIGGTDVAREQPVGADQDVHLAVGEARQGRPDRGGLAKARDHLDLDRELRQALPEGAEVLLRQDRGRHQHHHLLAVRDGLLRGAQGHLGLAVAHVAADQAVHGALGLQVPLHGVDRLELVGRLPVREGALEDELPVAVRRERMTGAGTALGVEVEQLSRQLPSGTAGAGLHSLPARRPQCRELRRLAPRPHVPGDLRELVGGREDAIGAAVAQLQVVAGDARDRLRLEAGEAGDAVVLVYDVVAHPQVGEGRQAAARRTGRSRPAPMHEPAEGDHRQAQLGRDEAVREPRLGEYQFRSLAPLRVRSERVGQGPVIQEGRLEPVEVVAGPFRLAAILERDYDASAGAKLPLELRLRLADAAGRGGRRLGPKGEAVAPPG